MYCVTNQLLLSLHCSSEGAILSFYSYTYTLPKHFIYHVMDTIFPEISLLFIIKGHLYFYCCFHKILTLPVVADHTFSVLSSDPLTIRFPENCRHVITWSSWPLRTLGGRIGFTLQFISMVCCLMNAAFHGDVTEAIRCLLLCNVSLTSSMPASRHFSLHNKLSSARNRQFLHVCAARNKSRGSRNDNTYNANCNTNIHLILWLSKFHI